MKLIYVSSLLPLALARKDGGKHPCMGKMNTLGEQEDCISAMYEEFNMVMKGDFPKKMKKGIKNMVDKSRDMMSPSGTSDDHSHDDHSHDDHSHGSTPSTPSTLSTPSPGIESLTWKTFPEGPSCSRAQMGPNNTTVGVENPCDDQSFCMHGLENWSLFGQCQVCPDECDIELYTFKDFENCCGACPNAICDLAAWDEKDQIVTDILMKEKMKAENFTSSFYQTVQLHPAGDMEEFLVWFSRTLQDSRKQPGLISAKIELELDYDGFETGMVKGVFKWVNRDLYRQYAPWRFWRGMFSDLSDRASPGEWDTQENAVSNMKYYSYYN